LQRRRFKKESLQCAAALRFYTWREETAKTPHCCALSVGKLAKEGIIALCMRREIIRRRIWHSASVAEESKRSITRQYCALLVPSARVHFSKECQSAENKSHTAVTTLTFVGFHANRRARRNSATESLSPRSIITIFTNIKGHNCKVKVIFNQFRRAPND
jgi:hypothetical protein